MKPQSLCFLSPVWNERDNLRQLVERCRKQAESLGFPFRMILVDDGSTDGSREVLRELAGENPGVTVLLLRTHRGKSAALSVGFAEAGTDLVATLDSDLQDQPEELPQLLAAVNAGADVASGHRVVRRDPPGKRLGSRLFNLAASLFAGQRLHDSNSGFKLYRYAVLRDLVLDGDRHRFIMVLARWKGFRVVEVPVRHEPRRSGRTKYGPLRGFSGFFDLCAIVMIEKFRHRPLHFFGGIGTAVFLAGLASFAWLVVLRLLHEKYLTNSPLFFVSILLMILGVNFFTTGMLAEFHNANNRRKSHPDVAERIGAKPGPDSGGENAS